MAEIDRCVYDSLQFRPVTECNIVVGGDTLDFNIAKHFRERLINGQAFSVG